MLESKLVGRKERKKELRVICVGVVVWGTGAAKGGAEGTPPPPKLGSQENSWLRRWAKYTKLCMVRHPNNCYDLSGGYAPPNHLPGALPLDPAGGLPFPRPFVPPPPNPGYATGLGNKRKREYWEECYTWQRVEDQAEPWVKKVTQEEGGHRRYSVLVKIQ